MNSASTSTDESQMEYDFTSIEESNVENAVTSTHEDCMKQIHHIYCIEPDRVINCIYRRELY